VSDAEIFNIKLYQEINTARGAVLGELLADVREKLDLRTALDVACGAGYFTGLLRSARLDSMGIDGRQTNIDECARRFPGVRFECFDAEDRAIRDLGRFDLVLCFGLLYHLENPMLAIRNLQALTGTLLLVESVVFPGEQPVMGLVDEARSNDQGLNYFAFYPTEPCLQKMLFKAGFAHVYKFSVLPDHGTYRHSKGSPRVRAMLAASHRPLGTRLLEAVEEPRIYFAPWDAASVAASHDSLGKLRRFTQKPLPEKLKTIQRLIQRP
jgi:SAM-dependent methyltransferase